MTPSKKAVIFSNSGLIRKNKIFYTHLTFQDLQNKTNQFANGLKDIGIEKGTKVLLMVKPGLDFIALVFAIFKTGAVPILIDPGMGLKKLFKCIEEVKPDIFIGIPLAHYLRQVYYRAAFKSVKKHISTSQTYLPGIISMAQLRAEKNSEFTTVETSPEDVAAILFTTGSTGPAKGVVYTHGIFLTQIEIIKREYNITENDIDLPTFPLFALFSVAIGATVVIPDMNPTQPAKVNPKKIISAIKDNAVTSSFGSPALWKTVSEFCSQHNIKFLTLTKILMAGAPVPAKLHHLLLHKILTKNAETYTPYGATESLPIATFTGSQVLSSTAEKTGMGEGVCVGYPVKECEIKIIKITDDIIEMWDDSLVLSDGAIGEIAVKGPMVTKEYYKLPEKTRHAKITTVSKGFWHRMGDLGYFDDKGRLWFCGRKTHRVVAKNKTYYTVKSEAIFNQHPMVFRSALVGIGEDRYNQTPVIIIEPEVTFSQSSLTLKQLTEELLTLAQKSHLTSEIRTVLFHRSFPVDIRHNAKIFREKLAIWAEKKNFQNK